MLRPNNQNDWSFLTRPRVSLYPSFSLAPFPLSPSVTEQRKLTDGSPSAGPIIGGILGALALIAIIIGIILFIRKRPDDEGPPKHKPPPPVKPGSCTEMLNKPTEPPMNTETAPLSAGEVYYEPTGGEPITNLDDDGNNPGSGALNGGAPALLEDNVKEHKALEKDLEAANHDTPSANIARGESFVSAAMYV